MHYKNGREAKNGDKVVMLQNMPDPVVGILHSAVPGIDTCNGSIRQINGIDYYANLSECVHVDDIAAALKAGMIPDSTSPASAS